MHQADHTQLLVLPGFWLLITPLPSSIDLMYVWVLQHRRTATPNGRPGDVPYQRTYTTRPSLRRPSQTLASSRAHSLDTPVEIRININGQSPSQQDESAPSVAESAPGRTESSPQRDASANDASASGAEVDVDLKVRGTGCSEQQQQSDLQAARDSFPRTGSGESASVSGADSASNGTSRQGTKTLR